MKKIFLILFVLFTACVTANAQFTLTRNGLVNANNPEQRYIVLGFEGKSRQELFRTVYVYLHTSYSHLQKISNVIENQVIVMDKVAMEAVFLQKTLGSVYTGDLFYTISIEFKDGRIKINAPTNLRLFSSRPENEERKEIYLEGDKRVLSYVDGIFDIRGTVSRPQTKQSIEDYFNNYVIGLLNAVKENNDW